MSLDHVLLAIGPNEGDRLENLAATTRDVAGPAGATVHLFHVFEEEEFESFVSRLDYDFEHDATPDVVAERHVAVRNLGEQLAAAGIDYTVDGAVGDHHTLIVEEAEQQNTDMVVVGGEKRSPAGKAMFGSTAQGVLLNADCPVLFVKPSR